MWIKLNKNLRSNGYRFRLEALNIFPGSSGREKIDAFMDAQSWFRSLDQK